jgi:small membrane protein
MEITIIQIIIIIFALFAWSRAMLRLRDGNISIGEFIFWSLIWSFVIIIAIFPDIITGISKLVGIGRGVDLAVYAGVILLFYLMFRLYVKLDVQSRETTKLVREIAIRNVKKKK